MGDGPYDFSGVTLNKGILEKNFYPFTSFVANVVNSCNNTGYKTYNNDISEVISAEYLDKYNYHVVQDNGGLLWGPVIWRKLFTSSFVNDVTSNPNNKLRQCLKPKDVYDWYNKTPMTLGHSTVDLAIPPENTSKTIDIQRGYYPWWDLNKYKLDSFYWGPLGHVGGILPFTLASNAKFNTLRSGGLLNEWAIAGSVFGKQNAEKTSEKPVLFSSQIKPDLGTMQLLEITDFNQEKTQKRAADNRNLSALKDGVYLLKVLENNENKIIPYIKNTPKEVAENEIVQSATPSVLQLKVDQDELSSVNIFDENKTLIKSISQKQYREAGGINIQDLENKSYTFEVVTPYYNLQFSKAIGGMSSSENKADIFTQKQQIIAKAGNDIKNISIYSISGSLIIQQEVNKPLFESRNLESGVYLVQMTLSNGKVINKKVKL